MGAFKFPIAALGRRASPALVLLCAAAVYYGATLDTAPDPGAEDGAYAALAQALATGQGYADVWLADAPLQTKYPFLFPCMLSPLYQLFGFNFTAFKLFVLSFGFLGLCLGFLLLRRFDRPLALAAVAVAALSAAFGFYARSIYPEIPFMAIMLAAVLSGKRYCAQEKIVSLDGALTFALFACAYFTRTIALCLIPALVAGILLEKNGSRTGRRMAKAAAVCAAFMLPAVIWGAYAHAVSPEAGSYYRELLSDPYGDPAAPATAAGLCASMLKNIYAYIFYAVPHIISGIVFPRRSVVAAVLTVAVAAGYFVSLRRNASLPHYFFLFYLAVLILWPWSKISGSRFIVPLLPFLFYFFFSGIAALGSLVPRCRGAILAAAAAALVAANVSGSLRQAKAAAPQSERQSRFFETALWVNRNSAPQERIMMLPSPSFYIFSNRKAVPLRCPVTEEKILSVIRNGRPNFALVTDRVGENEARCYNRPVLSAAEKYGAVFTPVMSRGGNRVFRLNAM